MPGKRITNQQEKLYMSARKKGDTQVSAAAQSAISERTGREIEHGRRKPPKVRVGRTRVDPFAAVWGSLLQPQLERKPCLQPKTLLRFLQDNHPGEYPDKLLRSLQRRVKTWRAVFGPKQEIMFRQEHPDGLRGLSDFTQLKRVVITVDGEIYQHKLYHFRLAASGWSYLMVVEGGESFTALAEGLQNALFRLGGVPLEHRTDSLSAAFRNMSKAAKEDATKRYGELCLHFNMKMTRNNRGKGHENGSVEASHGHLKNRIEQTLLLRESYNFESKEDYQRFIEEVVARHNLDNAPRVKEERLHLQPLPTHKAVDYTELSVRVSSSSTIDVRRSTYTVHSQLQGETLRVHLYHNRLVCHLGQTHVITLARVYPQSKTQRGRSGNYLHVIHSLAKKPEAFRHYNLRDEILPNDDWRFIWTHIEKHYSASTDCKLMVGLLKLATDNDVAEALARKVLQLIDAKEPLELTYFQSQFMPQLAANMPTIDVVQHALSDYQQLEIQLEVCNG